jgi:hypothetical protein
MTTTDTLDFVFQDAELPDDTVPPTSDVQYPCVVCGKEAGPYGGHGRKPTKCPEHKKARGTARATVKVSGAPAALAAQAAGVLEQLNGILAMGLMVTGMQDTAHALAAANDSFKEQAYLALTTDAELCKLILKGGVKSAKLSLGLAYVGLGAAVLPVAVVEAREKKAAREAARVEADEAGT